MQKTTESTIAIFVLAILYLFALPAQAKYNGGTGDPCDPYQINDPCQLNAIGLNPGDWDKHFILTADIDLSAYTGEQFNIIAPDTNSSQQGFQGTMFTGSFDGNGHVITNFTYATTNTNHLGMFGYVGSGGEIKNLGMKNVTFSGGYNSWYFGALAGKNSGIINNCYTTGSISGRTKLGALVGLNYRGSISNCYATCSVSGGGNSYYLGGLVGWNLDGSINNCYATGSVSGGNDSWNLGGLVGGNNGSISNCYATGSISGGDNSDYLGGLVGTNYGSISNCYATGRVPSNIARITGGLVGTNREGGTINSFWDIETSGRSWSAGGTGLTTAQMQDVNTFLNAGWDFIGETTNGTNVVWQMPSGVGYPVLSSFNGYSPPLLAGDGTPDNPYLIGDPNELGAIYHYDNNANYRLVADIDLSGINWSTSPIPFFRGYFDGNGYTIRAITIEGGGHLGLFGWIDNYGDINNLDLIELNIDAVGDFAGTLAGYNLGIIRDCCATGNISGRNYSDYLGGLVGRNWAGSISNSYATGNVIGGDDGC